MALAEAPTRVHRSSVICKSEAAALLIPLQGPLGAWFPRAWLFALVADAAALLLHLLVIGVYASVAS